MLSKSRAWAMQNERTSMLCLASERGPVFMAAIEGCGPTRGRNEIIIIHTLLFLTLAPLRFSWFSCVLLRWMALARRLPVLSWWRNVIKCEFVVIVGHVSLFPPSLSCSSAYIASSRRLCVLLYSRIVREGVPRDTEWLTV